ncbi:mitochondrial carrier protein, putative [Leishmania tarentolae]|uniref:Mitochondrial carrier protein, putative n=1 Tax=Leishmania tarentolae TaxID=5689 RepID=A0A640KQP9_LEITA|nr:mitochondrial carrier protein, putative [Leishmania tarentolae]
MGTSVNTEPARLDIVSVRHDTLITSPALSGNTTLSSSHPLQSTISMSKGSDDVEHTSLVPTSLNAIGRHAPASIHMVSSQLASATSTCVFYPFDTLKTRFMAQDGTVVRQHNGRVYSSIRGALTLMYREEGLRTLFRGCSVAVSGSVVAWGVYMYLYRHLCNLTEYTSYVGRSGVSILSSCISSCATCPIFLIKSRMQLEEANRSSHYRSFWRGVRYTVQTTGARSLWRGLAPQLFLIFPNALSIPTYDTLKRLVLRHRWHHAEMTELNLIEIAMCSTVTKVWILVLSHPLLVMKIRMQDERATLGKYQYRSVAQSVSNVLKTQGLQGMYRGFRTALIHSLPRSLLHYCIYEKTLSLLCRQYPSL